MGIFLVYLPAFIIVLIVFLSFRNKYLSKYKINKRLIDFVNPLTSTEQAKVLPVSIQQKFAVTTEEFVEKNDELSNIEQVNSQPVKNVGRAVVAVEKAFLYESTDLTTSPLTYYLSKGDRIVYDATDKGCARCKYKTTQGEIKAAWVLLSNLKTD